LEHFFDQGFIDEVEVQYRHNGIQYTYNEDSPTLSTGLTATDAWNITRTIEFDPPFFASQITLKRRSKPFDETKNEVYYGTQQRCTVSGRWDFQISPLRHE
jgi:hypothetical protein